MRCIIFTTLTNGKQSNTRGKNNEHYSYKTRQQTTRKLTKLTEKKLKERVTTLDFTRSEEKKDDQSMNK